MKIWHMVAAERPRERLVKMGAASLSLRELLAVLLGSGPSGRGCMGLAADVLASTGFEPASPEAERALFLAIERDGAAGFMHLRGIGVAAGSRLAAAVEIGRRYTMAREKHVAFSSIDADALERIALSRIGIEQRCDTHEWFGFVPTYRDGRVGDLCVVAKGARASVTIDSRDLFGRLLALQPAGLFLAHNHPSGDLTPSPEDRELTRTILDLCESFGLLLHGHWIVSGRDSRRLQAE